MKDIELTNSLFEDREENDMLISTELLISMLFANTRTQLTEKQREIIGHSGEVNIVTHQLQMMLNLNEDGAKDLMAQYLGEI